MFTKLQMLTKTMIMIMIMKMIIGTILYARSVQKSFKGAYAPLKLILLKKYDIIYIDKEIEGDMYYECYNG